MQAVKRGNKELVCIQDEEAPNSILAVVDADGWVTIGYVGGDGLIMDADDWLAFVRFVNQIESCIDVQALKGRVKSLRIPEQCDESL